MFKKEFDVKRMTNGRGRSNLLAIISEGLDGVCIGDAVLVPYIDGYKDPIKVVLYVDEREKPLRANNKFAIACEFIWE